MLLIFSKDEIWHDKLEAVLGAGQPTRDIPVFYIDLRLQQMTSQELLMLRSIVEAPRICENTFQCFCRRLSPNQEHRDGTANLLPRHVQQEQVLAAGGGAGATAAFAVGSSKFGEEEIEAVAEADAAPARFPRSGSGGARPAVVLGEMVQEHRR